MPAQVRGPCQLRHPPPRSRGLGSTGGGVGWKRAMGGGGRAQWIPIRSDTQPSSQGCPCRLLRLQVLRLLFPSQPLGEGPATSPSRGPAPAHDSASAALVSPLQARSRKIPLLLPKSSPQTPPDLRRLLCPVWSLILPRCTVPRRSDRPDPCCLPLSGPPSSAGCQTPPFLT